MFSAKTCGAALHRLVVAEMKHRFTKENAAQFGKLGLQRRLENLAKLKETAVLCDKLVAEISVKTEQADQFLQEMLARVRTEARETAIALAKCAIPKDREVLARALNTLLDQEAHLSGRPKLAAVKQSTKRRSVDQPQVLPTPE